MRSALRKTRNARSVMSSRLPMGVATRYSPGASGGSGIIFRLPRSAALAQQAQSVVQILRCDDADDAVAFEDGHHLGALAGHDAAQRLDQRIVGLCGLERAR